MTTENDLLNTIQTKPETNRININNNGDLKYTNVIIWNKLDLLDWFFIKHIPKSRYQNRRGYKYIL